MYLGKYPATLIIALHISIYKLQGMREKVSIQIPLDYS